MRLRVRGSETFASQRRSRHRDVSSQDASFHFPSWDVLSIHVINFKEASGRFFFHFMEVFEKHIECIRIFFIHFREISKFWQRSDTFYKNFLIILVLLNLSIYKSYILLCTKLM